MLFLLPILPIIGLGGSDDGKGEEENTDTTGTDTDVQKGTEEKTFTQADVDKVIAERLAREKKKYADYDNLKADVDRY